MLHKTRGIVLNYIKYKESSIIARIYTEQFGIQSYIINSVRSKKSKKGMALLQPLSLLDLVVYYKTQKANGLQRISEYKPSHTFSSIPFQIKKSLMALFITELLSKVLKEEEEQGEVFDFLYQVVKYLDAKESQYENIHLYLMIQLTHYIGFGIHSKRELERDGILQKVNTSFDEIYTMILKLNEQDISVDIQCSTALRRDVLNYMTRYYQLHVEGFKEMKSLEVLTQMFSE